MAEIFISYARSSEDQARRIAEGLRANGYQVWRDDELPPHRAYAEVIEERLRLARAVVVVWSADARQSQWVRAEAEVAREAGTLVQLSLDGVVPPLPFNQIQCADFRDWAADADWPGWRKVLASVAELLRGESVPDKPATAPAMLPPDRLLAVLAFDNLSSDPEMDYFSDGVSEEILETVARTSDLKVIGRSSSFQFRGKDKAAQNVAAQLRASHLLDGSVRRSGQRVRITASLVECAHQTTLWSGRFDRDLSDVFALQDEIAVEVAKALQLVFAPAASARKVDPEAYDLYLRARALAGAPPNAATCVRLLEEAVSRSPHFAAAWASLAMARAIEARWNAAPEMFAAERDRAIVAAERAIALDGAAGLPLVALSLLEPPGCFAAREALLDRAMAASPSDPEILKQASDFAASVGRLQEGYRLIARASEIDPLNQVLVNGLGVTLANLGRLDECYRIFEAARARWPDFDWLVISPLLIAANLGDWRTAEPLIEMARADSGQFRLALSTVALLMAPHAAMRQRMIETCERQLSAAGTVELRIISFMYAHGLKDEAFQALARSSFDYRQEQQPERVFLISIIFGVTNAAMRHDPRFVELCGRLGLCDYWVASDKWPDCVDEVSSDYDLKALAREFVAKRGEGAKYERTASSD